jgi:hypothetical protein
MTESNQRHPACTFFWRPRRRHAGHLQAKDGDQREVQPAPGPRAGAEAVSVREAARRAEVLPGGAVRTFPKPRAPMNAVAEEAQRRFRAEIELALAEAPAGDSLGRFRCHGGWQRLGGASIRNSPKC